MSDSHFDPFEQLDFRFEHCILTGNKIEGKEDMLPLFPAWMLEQFDISNLEMKLQTGEAIAYKEMLIPISKEARKNGYDYLMKVAEDHLKNGHDGLKWLTPDQLFQWMNLLFYGVLYYEYYSAVKNKLDSDHFLFDNVYINRFRIIYYSLRGICKKLSYDGFEPCTIVAFQSHNYEGKKGFDLKVGINSMTLCLRMGDLSLLGAVLDNGVNKVFFHDYFEQFAFQVIHPVQLEELYARFSYKNYLINQVHEYGVSFPNEEEDSYVISMRIPEEQKETPIFMDWSEDLFIEVLSNYLSAYGYSKDKLKNEKGEAITFLHDENGEVMELSRVGERVKKEEN